MSIRAVASTALPFPRRAGKVRDVYDLGTELLLVATDRISAYDVVMATPIPGKGRILTSLAAFWFRMFADVPSHVIATDVREFPAALRPYGDMLRGRAMVVRKATVIPYECVARGYLAGSAWAEYAREGTVNGSRLSDGMQRGQKLEAPLFTPATKADAGHDDNIPFHVLADGVGTFLAADLQMRTLDLYARAAAHAEARGLILADTKLEFGRLADGSVLLIDEILTPDSSRFWSAAQFAPGREPQSFDKQYLRNWLEASGWDKSPPAPALPPEVVAGTLARYQEAHERLTGAACDLEG